MKFFICEAKVVFYLSEADRMTLFEKHDAREELNSPESRVGGEAVNPVEPMIHTKHV